MKIVVLVLTIILMNISYALQMLPMDGEITLGRNKVVEFTLRNSANEHVAMKAGIFERNPNTRGEEGEHKEVKPGLFEIVKPNIILYPKGDKKGRDSKKFRVYYTGKTDLSKEEAYRIIVKQVPVDLNRKEKSQNKMRFLAKFVGALYVTPKKAQPELKVENVRKSGNRVYFDVKNTGNRRDFIEGLKINFQGLDKNGKQYKTTFQKKDLKNIYHHTILAGRTRKFFFDIPVNIFRKYSNAQKVTMSLN